MRITLDSNVLVRAVVSPYGPALALLDAVLKDHTLVLSRFILDELERVLMYPRIQARYSITPHEAAAFASRLGEAAYMVEPVILEPVIPFDPDDDPVLYTAADGNAEILCTLNTKHFGTPEAAAFCGVRGIRILTDVELLRELRKGRESVTNLEVPPNAGHLVN